MNKNASQDSRIPRDTMVFCVGRIAEHLLAPMLVGVQVREQYVTAVTTQDQSESVLFVEDEAPGLAVRILQRPAVGEFFFCAQDPNFRLLAPFRINIHTQQIVRLWLAGFEGSEVSAMRSLGRLMQKWHRPLEEPSLARHGWN